jgi:hypothetical protein
MSKFVALVAVLGVVSSADGGAVGQGGRQGGKCGVRHVAVWA